MGQSINRINRDYIIGILNEKISSYENMIKENYIEDFSCNKNFIINYANSLIDGIFNDTNNKKIYLNFLERLLFDEVAFLSYLTASDNEKCGIVYNNGDRVLYQGLNQALTLTVINTMALYQGKSQTFEYPSMMKERSNLTLLQVKEVASYDILNILGKDVYKCYFNGDGLGFHKKMQERLSEDEIIELSNIIDKSVALDDEEDYEKYTDLISKAKTNRIINEEKNSVKKHI